jgi:ribose transport system permease protein
MTQLKTDGSQSILSSLPPTEVFEVEHTARTRIIRFLTENWIAGILIAIIIVFSVITPSFFSQANWLNVSNTAVSVCLLAVTQTLLVVAGQIDLSQGAVMAFSGVLAAWVVSNMVGTHDTSAGVGATALAFAIALVVATAVGLINGIVIALSRLNPFIVTLGTYQACTGLANLFSNGQDITDLPPQISIIGNTNLFGWVSIPVLVAAVLFVILSFMLRKTRFGKYIYVIGDSEEAALRAGIKVRRNLVLLFTLSGFISGVAGVLQMARLSDASPMAGSDLLLNSIAAAIIGGTSLSGGRGTVGKTIIGGVIISVLLIGLVIANVQPYWQQVAIGAVIVVAVFIDEKGRGGGGLRSRIYLRRAKSS